MNFLKGIDVPGVNACISARVCIDSPGEDPVHAMFALVLIIINIACFQTSQVWSQWIKKDAQSGLLFIMQNDILVYINTLYINK